MLEFANTYSLSLPNEGHSFALNNPTFQNLAAIVADFIVKQNLSRVYLFGDYVGAKVAL